MSYANRPSHRADPTVAPVMFDRDGEPYMRLPFSPSPQCEARETARIEKKKTAKRLKKAGQRASGAAR